MILYHASYIAVEKPEISYSRDYLDFGKGFYLTTILEQAQKYAERFRRRRQGAVLSTYELDFDASQWRILRFDAYDKAWLDFVSKCRSGNDDTDFDMVMGGIANDKVIQTIDRYFAGEISEEQTLGILKYESPNNQICIRSQKMIDECLKHKGSIAL